MFVLPDDYFKLPSNKDDDNSYIKNKRNFKAHNRSGDVYKRQGYGSEENYRFMSENGMAGYVKYNDFHMEQRPRYKDVYKRQIQNLIVTEKLPNN